MKNSIVLSFSPVLLSCVLLLSGCDLGQPQSQSQDKPAAVQEVPRQTEKSQAEVPPNPPEPIPNESETTPDNTTAATPPIAQPSTPPATATNLTGGDVIATIAKLFTNKKSDVQVSDDQPVPGRLILPPLTSPTSERTTFPDTTAATPPIAQPSTPPATATNPASGDAIIAKLFANRESDVQVRGAGVVSRLLPDDNDGSRHQRFILKLQSGQTLLVAHNIDIAARLNGLAVGDRVEFFGEYFYSEEGGGIHWTHHDPTRKHIDGWLKWNGKDSATLANQQQGTGSFGVRNTNNMAGKESVRGSQNYIGNRNSQVLHAPTCNSLPAERNRVFFGTINEALNQGYRKHRECMGN